MLFANLMNLTIIMNISFHCSLNMNMLIIGIDVNKIYVIIFSAQFLATPGTAQDFLLLCAQGSGIAPGRT